MSSAQKAGFAGVAALTLAVAAMEWFMPRGFALTAFGDVLAMVMLLAASAAFCWNAIKQLRARVFWMLFCLGCILWTINSAIWAYYEIILRRDLPEPCIGDVILFVHVITFITAVASLLMRALDAVLQGSPLCLSQCLKHLCRSSRSV